MATALISDIGGTNSRFQLIAEVSPGVSEIIDRGTLRTMDHDSLSACIAAFLGERPACEFCVIAIAGLNDDHKCWSGSYRWPATSEEDLQKLGFRHVLFLNDLEAAAFGVAQLSPEQTFNINPGTTEVPLAPKGIISHGTGLGISFATAHSGLYFGWHSEHGSSSFGPKGELQSQYTRFLR